MKRQRAFLESTNPRPFKQRTLKVSLPQQQPLNTTQKRQIKRMIVQKEEMKFFRAGLNTTTSNVPVVSSLSNISQGDGSEERIGNVITPIEMKLRLDLIIADSTNIIRFVIFRWNDSDTTAPVAGDIFAAGLSGGVDTSSFYNDENKDRYRIMYDRTFVGSNTADSIRQFTTKTIKLSKQIRYTSDAVVTGTGKYYQLNMSDSAVVTHPTLIWYTQTKYSDS